MANVYVEARPKGRPEGSPITDYVVEDHPITHWRRLRPSMKPSLGQSKKDMLRSSLAFGI